MTEQTDTAPRQANPVAVIRQNLNAMAPEISAALPPHINREKFARVAMTAVQNTPELVKADRKSLFGSIIRLAQDGLLPDGREAALVIFGGKVQAMPMIGGILKRIRQSGEVSKVSAQVVHENDTFVVKYGFDEDVEHSPPALDQPRGKPIGAYATAVLKDGSRLLEVMSLEDIEKVRGVSRAKNNGPWVAWWGEMARKTVMRRLSKRLPMSTDLEEQIFSRDETLAVDPNAFRAIADAEPAAPLTSRLDAIEAQCEGAEIVDAETGEVTEAEQDAPAGELFAEDTDDPHPGTKVADEIIDEIESADAKLDITAITSRRANDLAAMPAEDRERVNEAMGKRIAVIDASRAGAKVDA